MLPPRVMLPSTPRRLGGGALPALAMTFIETSRMSNLGAQTEGGTC